MAISEASLRDTIEPAILRIMDMDRPADIQSSLRRTQLYNVIPSATATEEVIPVGSISPDAWRVYGKTGHVGNASLMQDFKTTFTHQDFPLDIEIPINLIDDNKLDMVDLIIQGVRNSLERLMEEDAASVFENAFDVTNFPQADGVALCSVSHPLSPADSSTVQSNLGDSAGTSLAFSYEAIKKTRVQQKKLVDHNNRRMFVSPTMALFPVDLSDKAEEISSPQKPGTMDNDNSAIRGFQFMDWDALIDTDNWFMIDPIRMKESLLWFNRKMDEPMLIYRDTIKVVYQVKARYSYGSVDWRWIRGHNNS